MTEGDNPHDIPEEDIETLPAHEKRLLAAVVCRDDVDHEDRRDAFDELATLLQMGIPPTQAIDAYAVDVLGLDSEDWEKFRDTGAKSVGMNVNKARNAAIEEMEDAN